MSLTAILWLLLFLGLAAAAMFRPIYGFSLYVLAFYAIPAGWWWGMGFLSSLTSRWSLLAALIFAAAVLFSRARRELSDTLARTAFMLLVLYAINGTIVHILMASNTERSYNGLVLIWKQSLLCMLIFLSLTNADDLKIVFRSILIGSFYVAYEIIFNHRGSIEGGRLEGIFLPGAGEANYMAGLMALALVLGGAFLFFGKKYDRCMAFLMLPFIFEVVLRCNSRGCYLALLAGGARLFMAATGKARRYALIGACLAGLAIFFQAKDENISKRFWSIFVAEEERDTSAQSRIEFTRAGWKMVMDFPFGSGAEAAFKSERGLPYAREAGAVTYRAVHNGYVDIAAAWGVQGFCLYMGAIFIAWWSCRRALVHARSTGQGNLVFLGASLEAALITQLVVCAFISSLDGEWFYWVIVLMLGYGTLYAPPPKERTVFAQAENSRLQVT